MDGKSNTLAVDSMPAIIPKPAAWPLRSRGRGRARSPAGCPASCLLRFTPATPAMQERNPIGASMSNETGKTEE